MKNSKKSLIIGMSLIILVALTLLGLTFAYYRTKIRGNENPTSIQVKGEKIEVTYSDDGAILTTGKVFPGDWFSKSFTVKNTGNVDSSYNIIFDNIDNDFERPDWVYEIYEGSTIADDKSNLIKDGVITKNESQKIIQSIDISVKEQQTYTIKFVYLMLEDEDQSVDMEKQLSLRINISETTILDNAGTGTLLYALGENYVVSNTKTIPGQQVTTSDEAILAETEDEHGYTYYFRGNIENNYVNYSGMCWRIVRVQGDGSIKLVLADENGLCNASTYNIENETSGFVDGNIKLAYKASPNGSTWSEEDVYFETSDIKNILDTWKTSKSLDTSKLVENEWCQDTTITVDDSYRKLYGAETRLNPVNNAMPNLNCDALNNNTSSVTKYTNYLGLLSADEIAFAGGIFSKTDASSKYYLETNAVGVYTWTLSPNRYVKSVGQTRIWTTNKYGDLIDDRATDYAWGAVRPSVVLKNDVVATIDTASSYEAGTFHNPYVIG